MPLERNRFNHQLQPIISKLFEDIADQDQIIILQKCYVHSHSLNIIAEDLELVITDEVPKFMLTDGVETIVHHVNDSGQFGSSLEYLVTNDKIKLILILGGIGCGKTTFLKRYQKTVGKDVLDKYAIWFYIDFLSAPDEHQLETYVYHNILNQLRNFDKAYFETRQNIKRAYAKEIEALKHIDLKEYKEGSPKFEDKLDEYIREWKRDTITYVQKLLQTSKSRKELKVVIFLDNVDQLPPDYQSKIFLLAQHITRSVKSITIIAMREESFYTTKVQKTFTAYTNKKFHIASPRFKHLIMHRIDYALEVLQKSEEHIIPFDDLDADSIIDFFTIIKRSIFEKSKHVIRFIEMLCFGNMRQALEWFTLFLTSGCTDVEKMLRIFRRDGHYQVSIHEFIKSVMLGDKKYYREEKSQIMNMFDCSSLKNASHFTPLRIIKILVKHKGNHTVEGKGYYEIGNLISNFEDVFDNKEDVINNLNRLVARQLVEVNTKSTEDIKNASHVILTSAGWYYYKYLVREFSYLDLVLQDTPLNNKEIANYLEDSVRQVDNMIDKDDLKLERMTVRFDRVEKFLDYLKKEEEHEREIYALDKLESLFNERFVPDIETYYLKKKDWIRKRIIENREKNAEEFDVAEEINADEDFDYVDNEQEDNEQ